MIGPLIKGLGVTLKHLFSPSFTVEYPDEKLTTSPRYRGRHQLVRNEDGSIRCVACMLCATVCPAECITIEAALDPKGRQYPEIYEIDLGRCIFCGYCVEACPKEAITMTGHYELAQYSREALVLDKKALMNEPSSG